MSYTIKRKGKTYDEYRQIILEQVQAKNLKAGDEAALLAKLYEINDEWFERHQKIHDTKNRIDNLKDLNLAIHFSGVSQKNPALVVKQILDGDEELLSSLESVKDQINGFIQEKNNKELFKLEKQSKKEELKEYFKNKPLSEIKAADRNKVIDYLIKFEFK